MLFGTAAAGIGRVWAINAVSDEAPIPAGAGWRLTAEPLVGTAATTSVVAHRLSGRVVYVAART